MPPGQNLKRLHSIRAAEEQQCRTQMNLALAELRRLEDALENSRERLRRARALFTRGVRSGAVEDRIAGSEETALADRLAKVFVERIRMATEHFTQLRAEFLAKRIQRRQVETLLDAARAQKLMESNRKSQLALDEWFRSRRPEKRFGE